MIIADSIKILGLGHPDTKTIFDTEDKSVDRYKNLESIKGRQVTAIFQHGDEENPTDGRVRVVIPDAPEEEIKDFIISEIEASIAA